MARSKRNTRERILEAAIDLFAERGFHATSMRALAAAVGIQAASLYAHFPSKKAILQAILEEYRDEIVKMRLSDAQLETIAKRHSIESIFVEGFRAIQRGISARRTERILRVVFNEMFKNPVVGKFGLDILNRQHRGELERIFSVLQRHGKLQHVDRRFVSVLYIALVNNYFHELFIRRSCSRDTSALERETLRHFRTLARLLSSGRKSCSRS